MKNPKSLAAALAFALLLVACGGDDDTVADTGIDSDATTDATTNDDEATDDDAMSDDQDAMSDGEDAMSDGEDAMSDGEDGDGGDDSPPAIASETGSLSIVSIDFSTAEIELVNNTDATIDINGWFMCNFPTYAPISGVDPIGPGETVVVTSTVAIPATDGELAVYTAEDFTNAEAIVTYVEWGSEGHTRASVATEAGIWDGTALTPDGSTLTVAS